MAGATLTLERPGPHVAVLSKSRTAKIFEAVLGFSFVLLWYLTLFGPAVPDPGNIAAKVRELTAQQPFMWLLVLLPVFLLPRLFRSVFIAVRGDSFSFDTLNRSVGHNGTPVASFAELKAVQVRRIGEDHRLSLILQGDGKVALGQDADYEHICAIADALADLTGTKVVKKD